MYKASAAVKQLLLGSRRNSENVVRGDGSWGRGQILCEAELELGMNIGRMISLGVQGCRIMMRDGEGS